MSCSSQLRSLLIIPGKIPLQVNEAENVYTRSKLVFFLFFSRHTMPLDQSLQVQTWKGRTSSHQKNPQVQWSILSATRKPVCSSYAHLMKCKPHFCPYAALYFVFPKSDNISCIAGMKPKLVVYRMWWLGLGSHQRRPVLTSCSATGFLCVSVRTPWSLPGWQVLL